VRLRYRILSVLSVILAIGLVSLGIAISYEAPCGTSKTHTAELGAPRMKAIVYRCYGGPEVLQLEEVVKPMPEDDRVLVKVHAAALNAGDWRSMRGSPYLIRLMGEGLGSPKDIHMGVDYAGTVEAVGKNVTQFKPGDQVFGARSGALAEYVTVREDRAIVHKPPNVSFEQAASVTVAAITALQALRDHGGIQAGQKVLINGASGGVGTFAVQLAKSFGAEVTGVCSTRNVELVRSIGADDVVDYTQEDFTRNEQRYDLILDAVGNRSPSEHRRVLKPGGTLVVVGAGKGNWIEPFAGAIQTVVMSPFVDEELIFFVASLKQDDLRLIASLMQAGKVTSVIDRRYMLGEVPAAMAYLEAGHARGKVVVRVID
jgi:NADPH:quinone reductase-like Zn-dependent oxidoreductase